MIAAKTKHGGRNAEVRALQALNAELNRDAAQLIEEI